MELIGGRSGWHFSRHLALILIPSALSSRNALCYIRTDRTNKLNCLSGNVDPSFRRHHRAAPPSCLLLAPSALLATVPGAFTTASYSQVLSDLRPPASLRSPPTRESPPRLRSTPAPRHRSVTKGSDPIRTQAWTQRNTPRYPALWLLWIRARASPTLRRRPPHRTPSTSRASPRRRLPAPSRTNWTRLTD